MGSIANVAKGWVIGLAASCTVGTHAYGQEGVAALPIDNLHHASGTTTGRAGLARVKKHGTGPVALILIAGAPFGGGAWDAFMERNEDDYTMWAVTPAGYEGTPPPPMPTTDEADYSKRPWTDALIADLVKLLEKDVVIDGKNVGAIVVGHHLMGDYYATRLAEERPALVRGVISISGLGSFPLPPGTGATPAARAKYVNENRVPFFRTVSQGTWNANTFPASSLSVKADVGKELYAAEIAVPIATQLRYYLEYATDDVETRVLATNAPVLSLAAKPKWAMDSLPEAMKQQLIQQFGSLEAAKEKVRFGGPWDGIVAKAGSERVRAVEIPNAGAFMMNDAPGPVDRAIEEFLGEIEKATPPPTKKS